MKLLEVVSTTPAKAFVREYTESELPASQVRVQVEFASAKHGTEFTHFRAIDPFKNNRFDDKLQMFIAEKEKEGQTHFHAPGNMFVGKITQVGSEVQGFKVGDRVAGYGSFRTTQSLGVKYNHPLIMPEGMSWKEAVCYDPAHFALGGIRDGNVKLGDNVVVFGLGAIGLIAAQMAKLAGARQVIVCDPIELRRKAAIENGADYAIDSAAEDAGLRIKELTGGRGADVTIETSGNYRALHAAIRGAAYNSNIAVVGWYKECKGGLDLGYEAHFNQPNILMSRAFSEPNRDYPRWDFDRICATCWEMLSTGKIKCENIVNPVVPIEQAADMYMQIEQNPNNSVKLGVSF